MLRGVIGRHSPSDTVVAITSVSGLVGAYEKKTPSWPFPIEGLDSATTMDIFTKPKLIVVNTASSWKRCLGDHSNRGKTFITKMAYVGIMIPVI